jgi:Lrp/AsnC family transcriptional regulator, leucine-responsive regulatory protein
MDFDAKDDRILAELQLDARLTMAELGRRVHLSQPAVTERVKRLEDAGVITGYRAQVSPLALGHGIRAVVRIGRCDYERMVGLIHATPEVSDAFNVTGEDSWVLMLAVRDVAHLDDVIGRFCALTETATSVVLKAIKERSPLRPASLAWPRGTAPESTPGAAPAPRGKPRPR